MLLVVAHAPVKPWDDPPEPGPVRSWLVFLPHEPSVVAPSVATTSHQMKLEPLGTAGAAQE